MKYQNAKCSCGFDLSSAKPGLYDEIYPGEYMGHCPSCLAVPQPVVEGEPETEPSEPVEPAEPTEPTTEPESTGEGTGKPED